MSDTTRSDNTSATQAMLRAEIPGYLRDAVLGGVLVLVLAGAAIYFVTQSVVQNRLEEALAELRPQAEHFASLVDSRAQSWLTQPEQTDSPPHRALTERLATARHFYPDLGALFTGRLQDGKFFVIVDTAPTGQHYVARPLTPEIPADSPEAAAIRNREVFLTATPAFRGKAQYLAAIVPLPGGRPGAIDFLYLDTSYDALAAEVTAARKARDACFVLAALGALIVGYTIFSWRCRSGYRHAMAVTKLRAGEELFRSTYEMSPVAMCLTDTDGRILRANDAFCRFVGYDAQHLRDLAPEDYSHPDDLRKERPLRHDLQLNHSTQYRIERRYKRADGQVVWGLASVAIVRDSDANVSHYMTQVVDITRHVHDEETLRLSQERLALAADAGRVGMWDCNLETRTMVWNDVMHSIFQTDPARPPLTFEAQNALIHAEDREAVTTEFRRCLTDGKPYVKEYRITATDGTEKHVRAHSVTFHDEKGRPQRAVGTIIDITKDRQEAEELRRAKEAALAADRAKSEFLAVMSHELRTPLNGVLGFVSMLKNTPLDNEQRSYIETMESSGQGLLTLVNDILDLSKIESREIHVEPTTFDVRKFIRETHQQLYAQAAAKGLHYDCFVEFSVPKTMHSDPVRLRQILINILGNAIKFTEAGGVDLVVSAKPTGTFQQQWEWRFAVRDSGPGIPADALPNLFKLFYQVDSSATRRHGGTGLGLAISQRLAALLHGEIHVRSEVGQGSEFTLVLTAPRGQPTQALASVTPPQPMRISPVRGKRILVVEDNPVNRKLCALQLKRLGCETDFAETGLEAVEKVQQGRFDAILMDMQLPDLDGCAATREIRSKETGTERLRIIALTANAMPEDRARCLEAGMDDFLSKPLRYETLAATLSHWA